MMRQQRLPVEFSAILSFPDDSMPDKDGKAHINARLQIRGVNREARPLII
jgi:hypothetical protein